MIEVSDITLYETDGKFDEVAKLMGSGTWMIRSDVLVDTPAIASKSVVHFWNDKKAVISDTEHPPEVNIPETDMIELSGWCKERGWELYVARDLLDHPVNFHFWLRLFRTGIIKSQHLYEYEQDEISRFQLLFQVENKEE